MSTHSNSPQTRDTLPGWDSTTAPVGNTWLAGVTAPPAGRYDLTIVYAITGATEASEANLGLGRGDANDVAGTATLEARFPTAFNMATTGPAVVPYGQVTMDGTDDIFLYAIDASTASTEWTVLMLLKRID